MTDSTTNRPEPVILSADETGEMQGRHRSLTGADIYRLRASHEALRADNERLRLAVGAGAVTIDKVASERDAAYDVIRNLQAGYEPELELGAWVKVVLFSWGGDHEREGHPMTDAERAVLAAVAGPDDTEENHG